MPSRLLQFIDYDAIQYYFGVPWYHVVIEVGLAVYIFHLFLSRRRRPKAFDTHLTEKEKEELIEEWTPLPLIPCAAVNNNSISGGGRSTTYDLASLLPRPVLDGKICKYVKVLLAAEEPKRQQRHPGYGDNLMQNVTTEDEEAVNCLNAASLNFLNLNGRSDIEDAAMRTINVYGVGACGPRGFYGTAEIHLELEQRLAEFFRCEEAALYSFAFATIASAIPSYSKRGDIIFADAGVAFAVQQGILASRSHVRWFKHNDIDDLKRILSENELQERKDKRKAKVTKKFLVVEGLYSKYGDMCPLPQLIELRKQYKLRLIIEESLSFGTLGAHGRGVTEYFNVDITDVDLICGSLENAVPAGGGFCVGSHYVVDHQRLSGSGYCFSASLPPLLAAASLKALSTMQNDSSRMFDRLRAASVKLHEKLSAQPQMLRRVELVGEPESPVKHIRLLRSASPVLTELNWIERENLLRRMALWACRERKVLFTTAAYLPNQEHSVPEPSLRLAVNCDFTDAEIDLIVRTLNEAVMLMPSFIPSADVD